MDEDFRGGVDWRAGSDRSTTPRRPRRRQRADGPEPSVPGGGPDADVSVVEQARTRDVMSPPPTSVLIGSGRHGSTVVRRATFTSADASAQRAAGLSSPVEPVRRVLGGGRPAALEHGARSP